jgi:hypothetical protein
VSDLNLHFTVSQIIFCFFGGVNQGEVMGKVKVIKVVMKVTETQQI